MVMFAPMIMPKFASATTLRLRCSYLNLANIAHIAIESFSRIFFSYLETLRCNYHFGTLDLRLSLWSLVTVDFTKAKSFQTVQEQLIRCRVKTKITKHLWMAAVFPFALTVGKILSRDLQRVIIQKVEEVVVEVAKNALR